MTFQATNAQRITKKIENEKSRNGREKLLNDQTRRILLSVYLMDAMFSL